MPTPQNVQQQQDVQSAQQGVAPMDFDPDAIMQEIVSKDMMNQMKEQELVQREQAVMQAEGQLQQMAQQAQAGQAAEAQQAQAAAQEPATDPSAPVPVAPPQEDVPTAPQPAMPTGGAMGGADQGGDISPQTAANLQPGDTVNVTKKITMTPNGPMESSRKESVEKTPYGGQQ
jgi:hypothetical protein